jgi:hypothetical protein
VDADRDSGSEGREVFDQQVIGLNMVKAMDKTGSGRAVGTGESLVASWHREPWRIGAREDVKSGRDRYL